MKSGIWAVTSQGISYYEYEKDSLQIFLRHNKPVKTSIIATEGSKLLIPVTDTLLVYEKELKHSKAIPLKQQESVLSRWSLSIPLIT
ncbi:hypothetical protein [Phocaeicola dorei]|uniref:hypothetical protein n=1 Tax=Phocaeicola dorei TaxID=357276 RepID=UPI00211DC66B|nr:hypothetical protein [Phocaeicola dorei]